MEKKKKTICLFDMEEMRYCLKNGIKVYPVWDEMRKQWTLHIDNNGTTTKGTKVLSKSKSLRGKDFEQQIRDTYVYLYKKLKQKNDGGSDARPK